MPQKTGLVLALFYLKQKMACAGWRKPLVFNRAENETRTRDPQLGKLAALLRVLSHPFLFAHIFLTRLGLCSCLVRFFAVCCFSFDSASPCVEHGLA